MHEAEDKLIIYPSDEVSVFFYSSQPVTDQNPVQTVHLTAATDSGRAL